MSEPMRILKLDKSGLPQAWLSREEAAVLYVKERVLWSLGDKPVRITGGTNILGECSFLMLDSIIACQGDMKKRSFTPALNNAMLFARDDHRCMYCGFQFDRRELTRDHVVPKVQGGPDSWSNVVAACKACNNSKGGRTPEEAGMKLLAVPFAPNVFEFMYLANRHIRGDQMEYLQARFSSKRCWSSAA